MAEPLELSYNWPFRLVAITGAALACIVLLALTGTSGWQTVAALVVLLWLLAGASICLRARAFLRVEGSELTVRRFRSKHTISGPQVVRVTEYIARQGPCHRLTVQNETGSQGHSVPTALFRGGHSTLFGWLTFHAPQAELDRSSAKTLEQLRIRGLIE
jgi:hypothetical protein